MISKIQKQTWESLLCVFKNFNFDITISVNLKSLASLCSLFLFLKKILNRSFQMDDHNGKLRQK